MGPVSVMRLPCVMSSQGYFRMLLDNLICPGTTNLNCVFNLFLFLKIVKRLPAEKKTKRDVEIDTF